ncbi:MAG TPA: beta-L-arabinofuranosidase domain-containing protein, partial [Streptosporangiaceae bacterium]|nr:beta-L-arabinofuranosidase domain-containing protein [Streptosporangiaceae bacterium]
MSLRTPDEPTGSPSAVDVAIPAALVSTSAATGGPAVPTADAVSAQRPLIPAGLRLTGGLLHGWQRRNASASMPLALHHLVAAGNLDNIRLAIHAGEAAHGDAKRPRNLGPVDPVPGLGYQGPVFMDSDIYKTLEAIGWELANGPRPDLSDFAASTIDLLAKAQQPDGYLHSYVQASGEPRYSRLAVSHEMYCAGHLIQAAIAMRRGTGDTGLLAIATRFADQLVSEFAGEGKGLDGHPVIETALAELYRETGNRAYLDLASQFTEQRGYGLAGDSGMGRRYLQD